MVEQGPYKVTKTDDKTIFIEKRIIPSKTFCTIVFFSFEAEVEKEMYEIIKQTNDSCKYIAYPTKENINMKYNINYNHGEDNKDVRDTRRQNLTKRRKEKNITIMRTIVPKIAKRMKKITNHWRSFSLSKRLVDHKIYQCRIHRYNKARKPLYRFWWYFTKQITALFYQRKIFQVTRYCLIIGKCGLYSNVSIKPKTADQYKFHEQVSVQMNRQTINR